MTHYDVFCYGEIGVDNIIQIPHLPTPELAAFPTADSYHIGGAAANTAVWLAGFGISVGLAGNAIGRDLYGNWLWEWLSQHRSLDLSLIERREDVTTPFCRAMVTPDGERTFLVFWYPQTPKTPLKASMLGGAQFVALDLYGGDERLEAARVAREAGAKTTVGDVIAPDHPALPLTDIATNSAAYIRETFPGVDVRQHARRLQAISKGIVITTDGPDEVYVVDAEGASFTVQPPAVQAVDATGAGDAFRAGLLYGLLQGRDLPHSVCWGVAAGALKVQRIGAASDLPSRDEVAALARTLEPRAAS
ncbi:MAG TPA: carbohydrate kinase family protein [Chloroflexi bacterium]|nr:carbohydrate kinase family protein [Chloroflexota bacterium]